MVDIKFGERYLIQYLSFQRKLKKTFQIMTLLVSGSGIISWKYFENYVWIAFLLILVMQLLLLIENQLIRSDKEIEDLGILRMMYTRYFNKIEKLWVTYSDEKIKKEVAFDEFYELREHDWLQIQEMDNRLDVKQFGKIEKKAERETLIYINKYHKS